jgi:hypothetical protein
MLIVQRIYKDDKRNANCYSHDDPGNSVHSLLSFEFAYASHCEANKR